MNAEVLGKTIKKLRLEQGVTQKVLAEKLNVSNKAVSRWETGDGLPDIHVLPLLSQALHVNLDDLLSESSSPTNNNDHIRQNTRH